MSRISQNAAASALQTMMIARPRKITFSEHCCPRDAVTDAEKALVDEALDGGKCNAAANRGLGRASAWYRGKGAGYLEANPNEKYRRRILGPCTPDLYARGRQRSASSDARRRNWFEPAGAEQSNNGYMVTDWWFAAPPAVVAEWRRVSDEWRYFQRRGRTLRLELWSHHVWMMLSVRFRLHCQILVLMLRLARKTIGD